MTAAFFVTDRAASIVIGALPFDHEASGASAEQSVWRSPGPGTSGFRETPVSISAAVPEGDGRTIQFPPAASRPGRVQWCRRESRIAPPPRGRIRRSDFLHFSKSIFPVVGCRAQQVEYPAVWH